MLFFVGALEFDTRPLNADKTARKAKPDFAVKPLVEARQAREFMGPGDDVITLSGQLLPFRTGGLAAVDRAYDYMERGSAVLVMRGDGKSFGWRQIDAIDEGHEELMRDGVGFVVDYSLALHRVDPPAAGGDFLASIISIFGG